MAQVLLKKEEKDEDFISWPFDFIYMMNVNLDIYQEIVLLFTGEYYLGIFF